MPVLDRHRQARDGERLQRRQAAEGRQNLHGHGARVGVGDPQPPEAGAAAKGVWPAALQAPPQRKVQAQLLQQRQRLQREESGFSGSIQAAEAGVRCQDGRVTLLMSCVSHTQALIVSLR